MTYNPEILLLNGPPRCGKDSLALFLQEHQGFTAMKFAEPLRKVVPALFSLDPEDWERMIEEHKSTPFSCLQGMTPREAQIWVSEDVVKPKFGNNFFGISMLRRIDRLRPDRIAISDSGFLEEAKVLVGYYGCSKMTLAHIYRPDCTFEGDSRSYIDLSPEGVHMWQIANDSGLPELYDAGMDMLEATDLSRARYVV